MYLTFLDFKTNHEKLFKNGIVDIFASISKVNSQRKRIFLSVFSVFYLSCLDLLYNT